MLIWLFSCKSRMAIIMYHTFSAMFILVKAMPDLLVDDGDTFWHLVRLQRLGGGGDMS